MENQTDSKGIIINYGLLLGAFNVFVSLIMYALGKHLEPDWSLIIVSSLAFISTIVLGIKKFKQKNNNFLTFGEAIKIGVGISIIATLIGMIYQYVFSTFIEPTFMDDMMELQAQKLLDGGMSEEQVEMSMEMGKKFSGPVLRAAFGIIGAAIGGFVISAITGAIMQRREEDTF